MHLKVNHILENSKVQGPGERITIWVQGCSIHCSGCNNTDTWDFDKGKNVSINKLIDRVLDSKSSGLTISGGEPLDQLEAILELTKGVFKFKDIFLCSGYEYKNIIDDFAKRDILNYIDMLCSGPFDQSKVCQSEWKGSRNQEVIYFTNRGKDLLKLPVFRREYRINKKTGTTLITGFSAPDSF
jgi:anaerobic ribonucleoside-triphosphate reductase activating protein